MKKKVLALFLIVLMILPMVSACNNKPVNNAEGTVEDGGENKEIVEEYGVKIDENTVSFIDGRDQEVTLNKKPERVVCLFNSYLDIWYNSGGTVVGRLEESQEKLVEGAKDAEVVGKLGSESLEKILSLQPDLVILNSNMKGHLALIEALEQNNIGIIALDYFYKDDYFKFVRLFTALNEREDLYEKNAIEVRDEIEDIIEKVPQDKEHKVLLMMASTKSITVRGSDSTVGEMLKDLNTINISDVNDKNIDAQAFSLEKIIEEDPDYIFVQTTGSDMDKVFEKLKKDIENNPAWSSLKAVKEEKYIYLPKDLYMYKPNEKYPEAYLGLAKILYPEVFN
jgi:iron complex transport system substrate-binding protein